MSSQSCRKLRHTRSLLLLIFALSFVVGVGGCTTKPMGEDGKMSLRKTIKVGMWGSPREIKMFDELTANWEKDHPDINIVLEHTPGGSYFNKILTMIAGGAAPDIIFTEVNDFVPLAKKNLFVSLNSFMEKDPSFDISEYFPEIVNRFTVDQNLYALPRDTAPFACVYFNKKLFDESGVAYPTANWDVYDFLNISQQLTKRNQKGKLIQWGTYCWAWMNFVYSFGGNLVDDVTHPTKCVLDSPEAIAGLQFYSDLMNKHQVSLSPMTLGAIDMSVQQLFINGKLAMYVSGIWETTQFREGIKDFEWDIVMFPKGPNGIRRFGTGGSGYAIIKQRRVQDYADAWEVLKLLAGPLEQKMLGEAGLAQPAIRAIAEGEAWAKSPMPPANKKMLNEAVKYAVYGPFAGNWKEIEQRYIQPELELAFRGEQTIEEAVRKIVIKANKLLAIER